MSEPAVTVASDAQEPSEVAAPVVVGRAAKRAGLSEPERALTPQLDKAGYPADPVLDTGGIGGAGIDPRIVGLTELLTEALTVLTIYAEVAVPVTSYRGIPMSAHAPRELVERIHRVIGA